MALLLEKFDAAETANPRAMLFLCHLELRFMDVSRVSCNICCLATMEEDGKNHLHFDKYDFFNLYVFFVFLHL